jgi:hypothetical protein
MRVNWICLRASDCVARFGADHAQPDPWDRRRQIYSLSPNVTVRAVEGGLEIDFGCCVLRTGAK